MQTFGQNEKKPKACGGHGHRLVKQEKESSLNLKRSPTKCSLKREPCVSPLCRQNIMASIRTKRSAHIVR